MKLDSAALRDPDPDLAIRRPCLAAEDGRPLPHLLSLLYVALGIGPEAVRRFTRRAFARLLIGRLPAMVARYPDGRRFAIAERDLMYSPIFFFGEYEPAESAVVRHVLEPGDFAVDVGANHGWFSILMASTVSPAGSVWAIEPVPATASRLARNTGRNPELPIQIFEVALGAKTGEAVIHLFEGLPDGHASASTLGRGDHLGVRVPRRTLDELLAGETRRPPTLVKLDAEGAELDVLRGAAETIASPAAPMWLIEANRTTSAAFGYEPPTLIEHLRKLNEYRVYRVDADGVAAESNPEDAHGVTWLCVPPWHHARARQVIECA